MFSSDLTDEQLDSLFQKIRGPQPLPTLLLMAGADEYGKNNAAHTERSSMPAQPCAVKGAVQATSNRAPPPLSSSRPRE